ncbi:MAG: apolipoprotein N-acyltransferase [Desulfosarcinaceae bacterium]|jgi:apolipoprotein N-acyltransferase
MRHRFNKHSTWKWPLAILAGLMLTASFPRLEWHLLAWIAWIPLLMAVRDSDWRESFRLGVTGGMVHYLSLLYWIVHTMHHYGHLPLWQCVPILGLMAAYLALYTGLLTAWISARPANLATLMLFPAIGVALEYVRTYFLTGFPWEFLGYSQFRCLSIIQIADLFGVYGVSALVFFANGAIAFAFLAFTRRTWHQQSVTLSLGRVSLPLLALILALSWGYGRLRLGTVAETISHTPQANIAVVQGNIDQARKWDPGYQQQTIDKYQALSAKIVAKGADLVVWPETATPFYLFRDRDLSQQVLAGIRNTQTDYLIGSPAFSHLNGGLQLHNSTYLIDKEGRLRGSYEKVHLVPFGEYVPLKRWLPFLGKLVAEVGDFKPGRRGTTLNWRGHKLGPLICYEIIFPRLARAMAASGANVLVNQTNDAWFGRTSAAYQHFSMGVFRAVENRRSLVRAANTGISGYIDPTGKIQAQTDLFKDAAIDRSVVLMDIPTLYSRVGDLFAQICLALITANLLWRAWIFNGRKFTSKNGSGG